MISAMLQYYYTFVMFHLLNKPIKKICGLKILYQSVKASLYRDFFYTFHIRR